jgi:hypothetical protein
MDLADKSKGKRESSMKAFEPIIHCGQIVGYLRHPVRRYFEKKLKCAVARMRFADVVLAVKRQRYYNNAIDRLFLIFQNQS